MSLRVPTLYKSFYYFPLTKRDLTDAFNVPHMINATIKSLLKAGITNNKYCASDSKSRLQNCINMHYIKHMAAMCSSWVNRVDKQAQLF